MGSGVAGKTAAGSFFPPAFSLLQSLWAERWMAFIIQRSEFYQCISVCPFCWEEKKWKIILTGSKHLIENIGWEAFPTGIAPGKEEQKGNGSVVC